jgi:predicted PurR-regulated permease PerM
LVAYLYSQLGSVYDILLMASFVPFLVYFMLSWRDHVYRAFLQLFEGQARLVAGNSIENVSVMVRAFVVGNFALGLLLAGLSSLLFWLCGLPYPFLVGPLSGFLSLIPYIGLPLAVLPPLLSALPIFNSMAPYLLIGSAVAVLHLIALNLLYPKIVGARVHLNPLVVTVALMVWGTLWGAVGLVFAIPLTAAIKAVCDNVVSLQPYGRLLGD